MFITPQILKYLEHCLEVEAGKPSGREEGLFWCDSPAVGKLVHQIISDHELKIMSGVQEKGWFVH